MAEYIKRETAIDIVKSGGYWEREDMEVAVACIEQTPTADVVEVKHGEWIIDTSIKARGFYEVNYKVLITCSVCGNRYCLGEQPYPTFKQEELKTDTYRKYRYCGECGAKMDGTPKERGGEK